MNIHELQTVEAGRGYLQYSQTLPPASRAFTLHKKWSFPLRISLVNVTKSAVSWSHSLKKSLMENFIFWEVLNISLAINARGSLLEIRLWPNSIQSVSQKFKYLLQEVLSFCIVTFPMILKWIMLCRLQYEGKFRRGKVTKFWLGDENFLRQKFFFD